MRKIAQSIGVITLCGTLSAPAFSEIPANQCETSVNIAAFNPQIFGKTKMKKIGYKEALSKFISAYDIFLLQEIRDKTGEAIEELVQNLPEFSVVISSRTGRTDSKEQYAIFYKNDLSPRDSQDFPDEEDTFEREPFAIQFQIHDTVFGIIGIHTKPSDAKREIFTLPNVISQTQQQWSTPSIIVAGDLNAGCDYFSEKNETEFQNTFPEISWMIPYSSDTTAGNTFCAYDRFLTTQTAKDRVIEGSVKIETQTPPSDHYAITMQVCTQVKKK